jgi:hypothetical protein
VIAPVYQKFLSSSSLFLTGMPEPIYGEGERLELARQI